MSWINQLVEEIGGNLKRSGSDFAVGCVEVLLVLMVLAFIIWSIYSLIDWMNSYTQDLSGKIVDKKYEGEHNSTGTAIVNTGNGVGVGVTSQHEDEQFLLFVDSSGQIYKLDTSMQYYFHCKIGDSVRFKVKIGGLSKDILSSELI